MPGGAGVVVQADLGEFGHYIEEWRAERDMLVSDVVQAAPVSKATLVRLRYPDQHDYTPPRKTVEAIAEWLGLSSLRVARMFGPDVVDAITAEPEPDYGGLRRSQKRMTALGDLIEDVRLERGHRLRDISDSDNLGIATGTVEHFRIWPPNRLDKSYVPKIATYLDISPDEVLRLHNTPGRNVAGVVPPEALIEFPVETLSGTKHGPTVQREPHESCDGCPVRKQCSEDVMRDNFAWCERIIIEDLMIPDREDDDEILGL